MKNMKIGDWVRLRNSGANERNFLRELRGKLGKVIDEQVSASGKRYLRVFFPHVNLYEDLLEERFEVVDGQYLW
tara:strand:+ start:149 stop:370 length:222 start_codon:yes stop_codon:yes gene_type:complete